MLGSDIELHDNGTGPAVLLVPGSFGTGAGWRGVIEKLGPQYRFITTSLLGYGATRERRAAGHADMLLQVQVLDEICDHVGTPVHMVGHSYGGLSVLAHAIHGRRKAKSLSLVEANPLGVLKSSGDHQHYAMFEELIDRYFVAYRSGDHQAARHVIDFYGGNGTFDAFPQKVRAYVEATTATNIADWVSGTPFSPPQEAYRSIGIPVAVIRGGMGHPAMMRIAERLSELIPSARLVTIQGGSHFLPATHASEIAPVIAETVARGER
jgi:pimeloyl-ACP methyl ester carboxylesterase